MNDDLELQVRRMLQQFEHHVVEMNKRNISAIAGEVKQEDFLKMAESISVLRAQYLKVVLQIAHSSSADLNHKLCKQLKIHRQAYNEAMEGFGSLKHALERGYFSMSD